ncbi:N-acetylmuramoyl-L-alanine amidase family protein [Cohnella zeiphila]|uniref:N-acetylmuramoyl-L-alanine amidase n=1 Tax=Cohnella zeiphila TaxID=2761120 RepID=A0A7X0SMX1_9BACL|nr:N-acetylmuramoyl-L-alanine amidase family protein [Cohnella zeiphila]MBB6732927.1 N-acetylmuramoyl-L-alanine amidase [Cohnella zeiphila]
MKKWTSLLFVVAVMLFLSAQAAAAQTVTPKLILDGKVLNPTEPPALVGNYTMVPVRIVGENLGYKVDYDSTSKKVTVADGDSVVSMVLDKKAATVNGQAVKLDAPPTAKSNTTLIPLRFVGEAFGLQVFWENSNKSVFLYSGQASGGSGSGSSDSGGSSSGDLSDTQPPDGSLIGIVGPEDGSGSDGNGGQPDSDPSSGDQSGSVPQGSVAQVHSVSFEDGAVVIKYNNGFLIPKTSMLTGPDRIVVDLPSANFAADFAPALSTDENGNAKPIGELAVTDDAALTKIRYSQFADSPSTLRFVLDLSKTWGYTISNDAAAGVMKIALQDPATLPPADTGTGTDTGTGNPKGTYTIVLDAGHGGSDPGAISITGRSEKDFTLPVILKLQALLAADKRLNIVLTRSGDTYPSLSDRYNLANSLNADLFLSVHGNSNTKSSITGTEIYYTRDASLDFANTVRKYATPSTGLQDRGVIKQSLAVTRETKMPAVLVEAGYLSNKSDESKMYTDDFQNSLAAGIAEAIKKYLNLD